jgi:hypothetical protein
VKGSKFQKSALTICTHQLSAKGVAEGDGDGEADGEGVGDCVGVIEGVGDRVGVTEGVGDCVGETDGVGDGVGETDDDGDCVGETDGVGDHDGVLVGDGDGLGVSDGLEDGDSPGVRDAEGLTDMDGEGDGQIALKAFEKVTTPVLTTPQTTCRVARLMLLISVSCVVWQAGVKSRLAPIQVGRGEIRRMMGRTCTVSLRVHISGVVNDVGDVGAQRKARISQRVVPVVALRQKKWREKKKRKEGSQQRGGGVRQ